MPIVVRSQHRFMVRAENPQLRHSGCLGEAAIAGFATVTNRLRP
jgi:hypothetical protein